MHLSWGASDYCIICCADCLLLSCNSCGETHNYFLDCPAPVQTQSINSNIVNTNAAFLLNQLCTSPASVRAITPSNGRPAEQLVGCCVSACERYVAALTSTKRVLLWRRSGLHDWMLWSNWQLVKRPVDLVFDSEARHLLVADKTGDVLQFAVTDPTSALILTTTQAVNTCEISSTTRSAVTVVTSVPETSPTVVSSGSGSISSISGSISPVSGSSPVPAVSTASPPILLGHLSMLLSLAVSRCGRYLVTGDRDEKVRVSEYPRAHNIASFCLGHTEFVGQLRTLPSLPRCLLSGSGDGTLRVWYLEDGHEVSMIDTHPHSAPYCFGSCDDTLDCDKFSQPPSTFPEISAVSPDARSLQCRNVASDTNTSSDGTSRERVVPRQCAVTCIAVSPPQPVSTAATRTHFAATTGDCSSENTSHSNGARVSTLSDTALLASQEGDCVESDLLAVLYDRARCVSVYCVTSRPSVALHHLSTSRLPTTPSTVLWLDRDTLAIVCALDKEQHEKANVECHAPSFAAPVLVYCWSGSALEPLSQHSLAVFAAQHAPAFCGAPRLDAKVLYKQRYDNEAEYQRKKQSRIQRQAQRQTKDAVCFKRVKLEEAVHDT